jgi:hypothetical protein
MFDTTERMQEETTFWSWLEEYLVGPLVVRGENRIKQIFAGRIPAPFQRHEVRRSLKLVRLEPLSTEDDAPKLIQDILKTSPHVTAAELDQAVDFILGFSFGHPGLSIALAEHLAPQLPLQVTESLAITVCERVIDPYVQDTLLGGIDPEWAKILRVASVLEWFDPYILQQFIAQILPEVAANKPEAYFIHGIASMRKRKAVIWSEQLGDRLHGTLREIIRRLLEVQGLATQDGKNVYQNANRIAANIIRDLKVQAQEAGEEDLQEYERLIQRYTQRAGGDENG